MTKPQKNVLFDNYSLWFVRDAKHESSKQYSFFSYAVYLKYVS